jgi:hypothetical protein
MTFFTEVEKSILKLIWKYKKSRIAKAILSQISNTGGITIPDCKQYYKAIVIKTTWYWHKSRHADQRNRREDPDTNPHNYSHLLFNKGAQNMHRRKDGPFNFVVYCFHV